LSRKSSGSHRQGISSVGVSDVAVSENLSVANLSAREAARAVRTKKSRRREAGTDVGQLLRSAYRQTVEEAVPDDLMDLLNRLE